MCHKCDGILHNESAQWHETKLGGRVYVLKPDDLARMMAESGVARIL